MPTTLQQHNNHSYPQQPFDHSPCHPLLLFVSLCYSRGEQVLSLPPSNGCVGAEWSSVWWVKTASLEE